MEEMQRLRDAAVQNDVETLAQLLHQDSFILDKAMLNNYQDMNPLHIAAMLGNLEFVTEILEARPELALEGDRFGRIPLHLAVIMGRSSMPVIVELVNPSPLAARERTPDNRVLGSKQRGASECKECKECKWEHRIRPFQRRP
ncbi:OLC1v1021297C1 [Oldenlandia corymbosa var. corymbosa]|uniref:OLC1v1021297C1 n=1 Tax=Oldenlandia corymbosa var. corymbosa TaxID=529605 RepID=A0AAV1BVC1_OLDCO|nr:OLC1v1021297C1 [Oldenlandia corymbosa var. corymbosa]